MALREQGSFEKEVCEGSVILRYQNAVGHREGAESHHVRKRCFSESLSAKANANVVEKGNLDYQ